MPLSSVALRSSDIRKKLRDLKDVGSSHKTSHSNSTQKKNVHKKDKQQIKKVKVTPPKEYNVNDIRSHFNVVSTAHEDVQLCSPCPVTRERVKDEETSMCNNWGFPTTDRVASVPLTNPPSGLCTPTADGSRNGFFDADLQSEYRRKFYIVQNGGSPAEMYCTDLVHKAKHGHNRRHVDESRLMKCVDKWREEWNHGVQMPLLRERPMYLHDRTRPLTKLQLRKLQNVSTKYIAINQRRYTKKNSAAFTFIEHLPLYHYEVDSSDEDWLGSKEGKHISKDAFLKVINQLEVDCYKNIHLAILEQLTSIRDNAKADEDADCDICGMPEWEPGDEIVFCDDCNIGVHQSCYGLDSLPTDDWMCATCMHRFSSTRSPKIIVSLPPCIFCPILGGAMKSTKNLKQWAHVVCALWIPEVRFGDVERREPISHISDVPADRWKAICSVCDTSNGACIRCTYPSCNKFFHVACAQRSGLVLQIEQCASAMNGVQMTSHCAEHSFLNPCRTSLLSRRNSSNFLEYNRNQLDDMKQNFFKQVDLSKISISTGVLQDIVDVVYTYWHWKRKLNSSHPLITEPLELKLSVQPKQVRSSQQATKTRQKNNIFNNVPSEELLEGFEKMRQIRLNLEKARNLCYMVSRREKLKKAQTDTFERVTFTMGDLLMDPVIPCSKRRVEKLLEVWESTNKEILLNDEDFRTISNYTHAIIDNAKFSNVKMKKKEPTPSFVQKSHKRSFLLDDSNRCKSLRNNKDMILPNVAVATNVNTVQSRNARTVAEEQKRYDDPYVFRSSSSPHLPTDFSQRSSVDFDHGEISDASNYSEYSVAWSHSNENDGHEAMLNLENAISPVSVRSPKRKKHINGKDVNALNGVLKVKKVNFKEDRRKSRLNNDYVLHHPELRDLKALPAPKKLARSKRNY